MTKKSKYIDNDKTSNHKDNRNKKQGTMDLQNKHKTEKWQW